MTKARSPTLAGPCNQAGGVGSPETFGIFFQTSQGHLCTPESCVALGTFAGIDPTLRCRQVWAATAERFAREGFQVVLSARKPAQTRILAEKLRAHDHKADKRTLNRPGFAGGRLV